MMPSNPIPPLETDATEGAAIAAPPPGPAPRIMVVDDDETALLLAQELLAAEGFEVEAFAEGQAAFDRLSRRLPDLLVLDVIMPGLNGFEFCSRLRRMPAGCDVPVLMTTSLDDTASIDQAYKVGATGFATKPVNWILEAHRLRYMLRSAEVALTLRQKEQETRSARDDWERTFNAIDDVVLVLDADLNIQKANAAAVRALAQGDSSILGASAARLLHGAQTPADAPAARALAEGRPVSAEMALVFAKGSWLVTASPAAPQGDAPMRVVLVARDITGQKQLEAQYRQSQKLEAVGTLAGGVAHDFNNLLQAILGYGSEIAERLGSHHDLHEHAEQVLRAAERAKGLVRQLLTFSRRDQPQVQRLDLNAVASGLMKLLGRLLGEHIEVRFVAAPNLQSILADAGQLEQILMNLCVNARDAMPHGGRIRIETQNRTLDDAYCRTHAWAAPGTYVMLEVADSGIGMPPDVQERVFEPFFTTKDVGRGTGLGLATVYGIVKQHQGIVGFETAPGRGTTFWVGFPALPQPASALIETQPPAPARGGRETILLAEDDDLVLRLAQHILKRAGYRVLPALHGEEAIHIFDQHAASIDLALLDVVLPKINGPAVLDVIRAKRPDVPVLLASGYSRDFLQGALGTHADTELIRKPYAPSELLRQVRAALDRRAVPKSCDPRADQPPRFDTGSRSGPDRQELAERSPGLSSAGESTIR